MFSAHLWTGVVPAVSMPSLLPLLISMTSPPPRAASSRSTLREASSRSAESRSTMPDSQPQLSQLKNGKKNYKKFICFFCLQIPHLILSFIPLLFHHKSDKSHTKSKPNGCAQKCNAQPKCAAVQPPPSHSIHSPPHSIAPNSPPPKVIAFRVQPIVVLLRPSVASGAISALRHRRGASILRAPFIDAVAHSPVALPVLPTSSPEQTAAGGLNVFWCCPSIPESGQETGQKNGRKGRGQRQNVGKILGPDRFLPDAFLVRNFLVHPFKKVFLLFSSSKVIFPNSISSNLYALFALPSSSEPFCFCLSSV